MYTGPDEDEHDAQLEDPVEESDQDDAPDSSDDDDSGDESAGQSESPTAP